MDIKFNCTSCGTHIVIDKAGTGMTVQCPKCNQSLTVPTASTMDLAPVSAPPIPVATSFKSNPTEQLRAYLASLAFPNNRDELRLLCNYSSPIEMGKTRYLQTSVPNPPEVIERFLREGFIQETNPAVSELLQCTNSSVELKALAREKGVSESGSKQELAERLVKADPAGMSEIFRGRKYLTCSPKGRMLVDKFRESEKYVEAHGQQLCFEALSELRLDDARLVAQKEAACLDYLKLIFTPSLLGYAAFNPATVRAIQISRSYKLYYATGKSFNPATVRAIQISAAMMSLWGVSRLPRWIKERLSNAECDLEFEGNELLSSVHCVREFQRLKGDGYRRKKWVTSGDELVRDSHRACEQQGAIPIDQPFANGLMYPRDPNGDASELRGCRCMLQTGDEFDEGNEEDDL
jgi:hypothetical protein